VILQAWKPYIAGSANWKLNLAGSSKRYHLKEQVQLETFLGNERTLVMKTISAAAYRTLPK
jgi:hypothetical protein